MSLYDYQVGQKISLEYGDGGFYGIIQAAMRIADTDNLEKLKSAFPDVWRDLYARYNTPAGVLPGDLIPEKKEFVDCTEDNPCCDRRNEYNGYPEEHKFTCPKHCSCHD